MAKTHGQSSTKLYKVWSSMKTRCRNSNDKSYALYGGRGINVCAKWDRFEAFSDWGSTIATVAKTVSKQVAAIERRTGKPVYIAPRDHHSSEHPTHDGASTSTNTPRREHDPGTHPSSRSDRR